MTSDPGWGQIILRLALATAAGCLFGLDRGERGQAAGLRTTLLVCLAAAAAMLQADLLFGALGTTTSPATVRMDLMRLPLGILSGMGFIGAGAILRRGDMVRGVTTAATLWFVTVIGLCFGGGQLGLGVIVLALGLAVLGPLRRVDAHLLREHVAHVEVTSAPGALDDAELATILDRLGMKRLAWRSADLPAQNVHQLACDIAYRGRQPLLDRPAPIAALAARPGVASVEWRSG